MRLQILSIATLAGSTIAAPLVNGTSNSTSVTSPCGTVTSGLIEYYKNDSNAEKSFVFLPSLANACLLSSSIDHELASSYAKEIKKYLEFQTTIAYLKAPPDEYPYPPVDILGGVDTIASKAAAGGFSSQYEFDAAFYTLFAATHEGHLGSQFCTAKTISYQRGVSFISISQNGLQIPQIYDFNDYLASVASNTTVTNVVLINGQNAAEFIQKEALLQNMDPDAAYNAMFYSVAREPIAGNALGAATVYSSNYQYIGDFTNLTYSNGTTRSYQNFAFINGYTSSAWSKDIVDGQTFTDFFCIQPAKEANSPTSTSTASASSTPTSSATVVSLPTMLGHPYKPVAKDQNNQVAGYFLNGTNFQDTAVLYVPSFDNTNPLYGNETTNVQTFINTTRDFFTAVSSAGKKKLIIDLSANGGGNTLLPNDLFKRIFPTIEPYGAGRIRMPEAAVVYGESLAAIPDDFFTLTGSEDDDLYAEKKFLRSQTWSYRQLTTDLQNITSFSEWVPPNVQMGDNFTINYRMPLNDTFYDEAIDGLVPYGYAGGSGAVQPFGFEDVVILTDGYCASACSIFTEFMTRQANVKTIAVGGRPQIAPMQAIGGTKGSLAIEYKILSTLSQTLKDLLSEYIPASLIDISNETMPGLSYLPLGSPDALSSFQVNGRDNIPQGDDSGVPLQFVFEPANCRIFYTATTFNDPASLWAQVHDIAWNGGACAWGGMDTDFLNNGTGYNPPSTPSGNRTIPISSDAASKSASSVILGAVCVAVVMLT